MSETSNSLNTLKSLGYILLGVLCAVIAFRGFMIPNHFLDGGINGISILAHELTHINIAIPLILFNVPFVYLGYKKIGHKFATLSLIAIVLLALAVQSVNIPTITEDKILIAIFGGLFIGLANGFVIKAGAALDGLEIIALFTNRNSKFKTHEIQMLIATIVFVILGLEYGWDKSMYSILTYFTAIITSNYVISGFEEFTTLTIVSKREEEIKDMLVREFGKAITVYKGERGYLPNGQHSVKDCDIIVVVVTRLEIHYIEKSIYKTDPEAFIYVQSIKEVKGGVLKEVSGHHD